MPQIAVNSHPKVAETFQNYPSPYREKLLLLRQLVLETAETIEGLTRLEETLKWGEPSYIAPKGSTLRMAWSQKKPEQYALYFKCTSKIVPTIKAIYGDTFNYEKNRALVFELEDDLPVFPIKHCISMALNYHNIKNLPLLGATINVQ